MTEAVVDLESIRPKDGSRTIYAWVSGGGYRVRGACDG